LSGKSKQEPQHSLGVDAFNVNTPELAQFNFPKCARAYLLLLLMLLGIYLLPNLWLGEFATEYHILVHLKLPIALTAAFVGAAISIASAALQVNLNNPLADPGIIGIASGASLMAALFLFVFSSLGIAAQSTLFDYSIYWMPLLCFIGASLSGLLIFALAKKLGHSIASFILAGIAVSTAFSGLIGWLYLIAPPQALQSLTFWLMGSLQYTDYASLLIAGSIITVAIVLLFRLAAPLNILYLGQHSAFIAGVDAKKLQTRVFLLVALLVGVSVSIAGSIAFLGLLVPHAIRKLHGFDNKTVFLCSSLLGASVILLCAIINEYMFSTAVPLSMLTASIGAPVFIYVLISKR
jgi:iron complex transport system permease protein